MRRWYVYVVTNRVNGKRYVGKTGDPETRWVEHVRSALKGRGGCPLLNKAIRKHGPDAFDFVVASEHPTEAAALDEEARQIGALGTTDTSRGYNLSTGGQSGVLVQSARDKIAATLRGHSVSAETRAKISASVKRAYEEGRLSREGLSEKVAAMHAAGELKLTDEGRASLSALTTKRNKERVWSEDAREKVRNAMKGRVQSEESNAKRSRAMTGMKRSADTRARMSAAQRARHAAKGSTT